ncbi:hypothetical protein CDAR_113641 [Caerostris darwini]|uniref:Uncharacterized protein n=1 Tax=Caerostris darwini TaxID=1538125 RepID=A0AAV4UER2_9ARAC|nr:hypothetical protein CDAR_113641 [Caerostris darwini]
MEGVALALSKRPDEIGVLQVQIFTLQDLTSLTPSKNGKQECKVLLIYTGDHGIISTRQCSSHVVKCSAEYSLYRWARPLCIVQ